MAAITAQAAGGATFEGVGGSAMAERGLATLFSIDELAINGFVGRAGAAAEHYSPHSRDRLGHHCGEA